MIPVTCLTPANDLGLIATIVLKIQIQIDVEFIGMVVTQHNGKSIAGFTNSGVHEATICENEGQQPFIRRPIVEMNSRGI